MTWAGRSVLAYFTRREQAEQARRALRHEGFETVQLDRIGRYGGGSSPVLHTALTGDGDSLADMTAGADTGGGDAGPLLAADPAASGLADGLSAEQDVLPGMEHPAWLVTVVTGEDRVNRAVQILEDAGGVV